MIGKVKRAFCIAIGTTLAFGVLGVSAAQAFELVPEGEVKAEEVTISGTNAKGKDLLKLEPGSVECKTSLHAVVKYDVSTFELAPSFSECSAFGVSATLKPEKCKFRYTLEEKIEEDVYGAVMAVVCGAGESIKFSGANCEAEIKPQTGKEKVKFINMKAAPPADMTIRYEVKSLAYTVTKDGFGCPFNGTGAKTNGEYTTKENMTLVGTNPNNALEVLPILIV